MYNLHFIAAAIMMLTVCNGKEADKPEADKVPDGQISLDYSISSPQAHDPVMAKEGDNFYVFGTHNMGMTSKDLRNWAMLDYFPSSNLDWIKEYVPRYGGDAWAPDVIYHNGKWHLFYSASAFGRNTSAIGHFTRSTLAPTPEKWVDEGEIIHTTQESKYNAIDPNVAVAADGSVWMTFGSFWDGIQLVEMTEDMSSLKGSPVTIARRTARSNPIEGPFIYRHGDYYYLFVSWDFCCRGNNSTYRTVVGRSKDIRGPYLDNTGKDMAEGGGYEVVFNNDIYNAAGHCSAYTFDGKDYFVCHAYRRSDGGADLIIREIKWDGDGWPVVSLDATVPEVK